MGSSKKPYIVVKNLWKAYRKLQVLKGLDLTVYQGETLVILGRSGVGKSVLLRQIIGIEHPDEGCVEIDGANISTMPPGKRFKYTKEMGMLFQGAALFDSMTVGENVGFYLSQHPDPATGKWVSEKEQEERVAHALEMVGLAGSEKKMPSELSGGMRKRAALARLILYRPKILLYDEPTTGLDPVTAMQINELIVETQKELDATSIVVTHDIRSAMEVGDRLAFHSEGKISYVADKSEFIKTTDPLIHSFFENAVLTTGFIKEKAHEHQ